MQPNRMARLLSPCALGVCGRVRETDERTDRQAGRGAPADTHALCLQPLLREVFHTMPGHQRVSARQGEGERPKQKVSHHPLLQS